MIFLYFSGTGNTKYCVEYIAKGLGEEQSVYSIEQPEATRQLKVQKDVVLAYPIYYSALPKILSDYIKEHSGLWAEKNIFLIATMGLFSGDGSGVAARRLKKYGANIVGGLHLTMPDCILDVKALKKPKEKDRKVVKRARKKMDRAIAFYQNKQYPKEGLHWWNHLAGLFCQRLYFYGKTRNYTDQLKIDAEKCIGCGVCAAGCPMKNISMTAQKAVSHDKCTMCYRCISNCPKKAITLIGKEIVAEAFNEYE